MKFGVRKRSYKKSFKAKTTGKLKRKVKKATNPFYGKKGMGWIRDPKRAMHNKVYRKTTIDRRELFKASNPEAKKRSPRPTSANNASRKSSPGILALISGFLLICLMIGLSAYLLPVVIVIVVIVGGIAIYRYICASHKYSSAQIIKLSKIISVESEKQPSSTKMVKLVAAFSASAQARIKEAETILAQTTDMAEFFSALDVYVDQTERLKQIEVINAEPEMPEFTEDSAADDYTLAFIDRTFKKEVESASTLKTDRGKQNRYRKYFDALSAYDSQLSPIAQGKISQLMCEYIPENTLVIANSISTTQAASHTGCVD